VRVEASNSSTQEQSSGTTAEAVADNHTARQEAIQEAIGAIGAQKGESQYTSLCQAMTAIGAIMTARDVIMADISAEPKLGTHPENKGEALQPEAD
jgi:hypothetical protein